MIREITEAKAEELNALREVFGPENSLLFLKLTSRDEAGAATYDVLQEYPETGSPNGWFAERVTGSDGAIYTKVRVADVDGSLETLMSADMKPTDFSVSGKVYRLELKQVVWPMGEPREWIFRAYVETGETYP